MPNRRTKEVMFSLIEAWLESTMTQQAFCDRHDLHLATFTYWRSKHQKAQKAERASRPISFCEITPPPLNDTIQIHYPNGVQLHLPSSSPIAMIQSLIR